jgi:rhodanese-related sulfurtransferase
MVVLTLVADAFAADDVVRIKPQELKTKLGQPGLSVVDVRIVSDWKKSDRKIAGAVREDPHDVSSWADKYPKHEPLVVYCS